MSYRDDLEAAQARAEAAERRAAALEKQITERDRPARDESPPMPIPERFTLETHGNRVAIQWRWFKASRHLPLLFFSIAWDAFLVFWYASAIRDSHGAFALIFPIAHVAVGVGLTYSVLASIMNRTHVTAGSGHLAVQHGPVRWRGNVTLARSEIKQLYVTEKRNTDSDGNRTASTWNLCALRTNGKELTLVKGLDEHSQGLYLEHVLEKHLGISDGKVASEALKPG